MSVSGMDINIKLNKPVGDWFARCLTICDIGVSLHLWAYVDISK